MALIFIDSFDHYATGDIDSKWTSVTGSPTIGAYGRNSTNGMRASTIGTLELAWLGFDALSTGVLGFALKAELNQTSGLCAVFDGSANNTQIQVFLATDGSLAVYRAFGNGVTSAAPFSLAGATSLGTSAGGIIVGDAWHYVEIKWTLSNSVGAVTIRVDGETVLTITGADTQATANAYATSICLGHTQTTVHDFDDFYLLDTTGADNTDFLGDVRIAAHLPSGAGNSAGWTPSAGNNYACVDEDSPNDDTDYVSTDTIDAVDTYAFDDLVVTGATILGVQVLAYGKKEAAGVCTVAPVVRRGGTDYAGTADALSESYAYHVRQVYDTDPGTGSPGAAWTEATFNAAEFGIAKSA